MAKTGIFHHVGTFLLLAAAVLLLITTISAPIINDIPILKVKLANHSSVSFGTFGHCILDAGNGKDYCTGRHIGYNPANTMEQIDNTDFSRASVNTSKALTRVMILHPVACGLAFIAFLLALGAGVCGAIFASMVSAIAWVVTVVVMACDFTLFAIVKNHVNRDESESRAHYSTGMWTVLAAMICLFFATFIVLFTCFSSRMHRQHERSRASKAEAGYVGTSRTTRRHFWQRRNRY